MRASAAANGSGRSWWSRPRPCSRSPREHALMAGAALECVHCYSLAHDDLPAMDNDDLRRGQPTAHKKFDEATAILAGDGLLTLRLRHAGAARDASESRRCASSWSRRSRAPPGSAAWSAGRCSISPPKAAFDGGKVQKLGDADVKLLQAMKTGALLRFGCLAGAILGEATPRAARGARPLRHAARRSVPDRRRSARRRRRCRDRRQGDRQGRGRRQRHIRHVSSASPAPKRG